MLHQSYIPTPPQYCNRLKLGPVLIALLLILALGGLGLLAMTTDIPADSTNIGGTPGAREYLPKDETGSTQRSLHKIVADRDIIPSHDHPLLGRSAPDFELTDNNGKVWKLRELLDGHQVILIFYQGYHCVHCVRQLFDINRDLALISQAGARVVAVSADPAELTGQRFQQYGSFAFPLLSDPGRKVAKEYQMFRRHGTFVIDQDGTVRWVNVGDAPFRRNPALLYQLTKKEDRFPLEGSTLP